jgi:hypothetical protein
VFISHCAQKGNEVCYKIVASKNAKEQQAIDFGEDDKKIQCHIPLSSGIQLE